MAIGRSAIPFGSDDASRFLPWMLAFMVYLAALALAGVTLLVTQEMAAVFVDNNIQVVASVEAAPNGRIGLIANSGAQFRNVDLTTDSSRIAEQLRRVILGELGDEAKSVQ